MSAGRQRFICNPTCTKDSAALEEHVAWKTQPQHARRHSITRWARMRMDCGIPFGRYHGSLVPDAYAAGCSEARPAGSGCTATALCPRLRICLAKIDGWRGYRNIYKRNRTRVFETMNITLRKPHYVTGSKRLSHGTAKQQSTGTRDCNPDLLRCFMPMPW